VNLLVTHAATGWI